MTSRRLACIAALVAIGAAGAIGAACTSHSGASHDAGASSDSGTADAPVHQDSGETDAGQEAGLDGNCEPVKGPCDLVLQDCPAGQECVIAAKGGGYTTQCAPAHASEHIARGYPCCPPVAAADNPCLPGLECVGNQCIGDASGGGRCAPHCCNGDDTPCGSSPEGWEGHCDLQLVDNSQNPLYNVCEYSPPCRPLRILPCPSGDTCIVQDTSGGAKCVQIFNNGKAGLQEGETCQFTNQCQDGLMCLGAGNCMMLCYLSGHAPPFDAGALGMGPGTGGCNAGKTCVTAGFPLPQGQPFPDWLGVCQ